MSIKISEAEIAKKIKTSRQGEKMENKAVRGSKCMFCETSL